METIPLARAPYRSSPHLPSYTIQLLSAAGTVLRKPAWPQAMGGDA